MAELDQKKQLSLNPAFSVRLKSSNDEYTHLLVTGDMFKKWPAKKKIQKGSFTTRLIWSSDAVDRLQWGEPATKSVMGFLLMQEVVHVQEDPTDKLKFTIFVRTTHTSTSTSTTNETEQK